MYSMDDVSSSDLLISARPEYPSGKASLPGLSVSGSIDVADSISSTTSSLACKDESVQY
jgi:hypothetical protein